MTLDPAAGFSALLLAGGRSRRMGRDKALLLLPDGRPLWRRQIEVLAELRPAALFVAGPPREGFPVEIVCLDDPLPGAGPLAGLTAGLAACRTPLLAVLAIDLPAMTAACLRGLLDRCRPGLGAVPARGGFHEPLAAVYPVECLPLARWQLPGPDRSLQSFVRAAEAAGRVRSVAVNGADEGLFLNWNHPADVTRP